MSAITARAAHARQTTQGGPPRVEEFPEAASQTFKKGEAVYLVAGYVTECSANPTQILGLAAEDAHNSTAGAYNVAVELAEPTTLFRMNIAADTSGASLALTQAMLGLPAAILLDTTNSKVYAYGGVIANARVVIEKFIDAVGDTNAAVLVRFLSNYFQLGATS